MPLRPCTARAGSALCLAALLACGSAGGPPSQSLEDVATADARESSAGATDGASSSPAAGATGSGAQPSEGVEGEPDDAWTSPVDGEVDAGPGSLPGEDAGRPPGDALVDFEERDGLVVFEAEHYFAQDNDQATRWVTFSVSAPDPGLMCVVNVVCSKDNRPDCNQYSNCDGDAIDPATMSGGAYVEALPDRRRDDSEANTGELGVVNNPDNAATLRYRVRFAQPGRYYVWALARGQGPAANGLHVGLDGAWPRNDLIDAGSMRLQFPSGRGWTQNRRGAANHTGVPAGSGVSRADANVWLQVEAPGEHEILLGMREDGLELDKVLLTRDPDFVPKGDGPAETTAGN